LHAIVDRVIDDYEPIVGQLDAEIRSVEADVFSPTRSNAAERIYGLKRAVLDLHAALGPLIEPLSGLASGRHRQIDEDLHSYYRDVHDHVARMVTQVGSFRELLTSVLTANLTQASVRQNEDVRRISAWAAIIAVPTMIAGIYGMNFDHMPELEWVFGYPLVLAVIGVVCVLLYRSFRKAGWL